MMFHRPESSEHGAAFDLAALEREMRHEPAFVVNGHTARTLVRSRDLRLLLIVMQSDSRIAEHVALETATVYVLSGHLCLHLPDRSVDLPAGHLLLLPAGLRHDVEATGESAFLLTLGWSAHQP
jgi:quercetin dioxygenase-like cupin family protein